MPAKKANRKKTSRDKTGAGLQDYREILFTKSIDWEYEREWRVLSRRPSGGGPGLHSFPAEALVSVICGCKMEEPMRKRIENLTAHDGVSLNRAALSQTRFAVDIQ